MGHLLVAVNPIGRLLLRDFQLFEREDARPLSGQIRDRFVENDFLIDEIPNQLDVAELL